MDCRAIICDDNHPAPDLRVDREVIPANLRSRACECTHMVAILSDLSGTRICRIHLKDYHSGSTDIPRRMDAPGRNDTDPSTARLGQSRPSSSPCDKLPPHHSQIHGAENSINNYTQLRNQRGVTSRPRRSFDSFETLEPQVMSSSHGDVNVLSLDDQPRSREAGFAPSRSMDSSHVPSDTALTAAHYAVKPNDCPREMDGGPSGRPEESCKAQTRRTVDSSETIENRALRFDNVSASPEQADQSDTTAVTSSRVEGGIFDGIIAQKSNTSQASVLLNISRQPESASSSALPVWQPIYLQPSIQISAMFVFFLLAAIIEVLLVISLRNDGLATSREDIHYLWTYGPTALLTLIAAVWDRVAFQAQLVAPWHRLMQAPAKARDSILLDYFDMISPVAIFNSLKNHDWLVSGSLSVSLLIQLIIVLSTGLINLNLIQVTDTSYTMRLTRKFINGEDPVTDPSKEVLGMIDGLLTGVNGGYLALPDGTSDLYSWETFETEVPVDAELRTTVTGFSANLTCEPAITEMQYSLRGEEDAAFPCGIPWITMNMSSPNRDCVATYSNEQHSWFSGNNMGPAYFSTVFNSSCQGAAGLGGNRVVFIFGQLYPTWASDEYCYEDYIPQDVSLQRYTALICSPGYLLQELDISRNGTGEPIVQLNKNSSSWTLENVHPWTIMNNIIVSMRSQDKLPEYMRTIEMLDADVISDGWTFFILLIGGVTKQYTSSMFDSATLEAVLQSYYQKYAAQLAPALLMQPSNELRKATATLLESRLLVSPWICHIIAGLLIFSGLTCLCIGTSPQRKVSLSFNPSIPYGTITAFSHGTCSGRQFSLRGFLGPERSPQVLSIFSYLAMPTLSHGIRDASLFKALSEAQVTSHHGFHDFIDGQPRIITPLTLQPYSRCFVSLAFLGIMVTLGVTLQVSNTNRGLGETESTLYMHFLWTSLPAGVFSVLSLTLGSMASAILCLSPYWNMKRSAHYAESIGLNLLSQLPIISLFRAAQLGFVAAATATAASLLTPWFNIFTPSLFEASSFPTELGASLVTTGSFGDAGVPLDGAGWLVEWETPDFPTTLGFQILQRNMSYPAFTWENLAFPEFSLNGLNTSDGYNMINATIEARVPAFRSSLSCKPYTTKFSSNLTLGHTQEVDLSSSSFGEYVDTVDVSNPLVFNLISEKCAYNTSNENLLSVTFDTTIEGVTPSHSSFMAGFAGGDYGKYGLLSGNNIARNGVSCKPFVFIWGGFNLSGDQRQPEISFSAMACQPTVDVVDVNLTLRGPELAIGSVHVDDASARQTSFGEGLSIGIGVPSLFPYVDIRSMFNTSQPQLFDGFASVLTTSPYALTPEDIENPEKAQQVEDAIKFQYGILQTQHFHTMDRCEANRTNATLPNYAATSPEDITDALTYPAVVTIPNGNRRVIQDPVSTYILEGLLAVVLALTLVSWAFSLKPGVLPRSPTSIANVLFLAAGGNLLQFIVKNTDGGPPSRDLLDKYIFWLGWRKVPDSDEGERERFGIWVLTAKEFEVVKEEQRRSKLADRKGK